MKLTDVGISNFEAPPRVYPGTADALLAGETVPHYADNHWGKVSLIDGVFHEEVWRLGRPIDYITADSLEALIGLVNGKYGAD